MSFTLPFLGKSSSLTQPTTTVVQPPTPPSPPVPTTEEGIKAFVEAQPELFRQQQEFAPQEAQQQLDLLREFGGPTAQALFEAQQQIAPVTTSLQEQLAQQAVDQLSGDIPQREQEAILSDLNALLGRNVSSGAGDVFRAKAFAGERFRRQQSAQNLALSLAGRQPIPQPQSPNTTQFLGSLTPGQVLGQQSNTFSTQAGLVPQPFVSQGASPLSQFGSILSSAAQLGAMAGGACWVAAEVFGGWYEPRTCACRNYILNIGPKWFKQLYIKFGERFAKLVKKSRTIKRLITPLFEKFARWGGYNG